MLLLKVDKVSKVYKNEPVLKDISFDVEAKSFISIFGANGSGKTTLLNIIAGLDKPTSGAVRWTDEEQKKNISFVFQNYRETLLPWKRIWENIALPLKLRGISQEEQRKCVDELLEQFSIKLNVNKYPYQLSGGQQQLVAILRAVITKPVLLLLDEPFSALDFQRRLGLHEILLQMWGALGITMILISHDLEEAIFLADKVILLGKYPLGIESVNSIALQRPRTIEMYQGSYLYDVKRDLVTKFSFINRSND